MLLVFDCSRVSRGAGLVVCESCVPLLLDLVSGRQGQQVMLMLSTSPVTPSASACASAPLTHLKPSFPFSFLPATFQFPLYLVVARGVVRQRKPQERACWVQAHCKQQRRSCSCSPLHQAPWMAC